MNDLGVYPTPCELDVVRVAAGALFSADAATTCTNKTCVGVSLGFSEQMNVFDYLFHQSVNRYDSIIGTSYLDLSYLRKAGGKVITWHGLADSLVAPGTSLNYTQAVYERDLNTTEYYRYFEAPGVDHYKGGNGSFPGNAMQSLIDWVENGVALETLEAKTQGDVAGRKANLCLWPKKLIYVGGEPNNAGSFESW